MTDAIPTWLLSLPRKLGGEVVVPATIDFWVLDAISAAEYVPVLTDVRPGVYVAEAESIVPALIGRAVGTILPWTHGNAPDLEHITPACDVHEAAIWSEPPPVWAQRSLYLALYDLCSQHMDKVTLPQHLCQAEPRWTCLPLLARDALLRDRYIEAIPGAKAMRGVPTDAERAQLGPNIIPDHLPGARDIGARGFTVPLVAGIEAMVVEALA